jgi:serine/threonine-protein kinase
MSEVRFGDYRITATIGTGALSTIYRAVKEPIGRVVALKALKSQIAASSSFGDQLDREAKILADLAHPNVVLMLEAGRTSSGRPYVVLEHIEGPSLQELLAASKDERVPGRSSTFPPKRTTAKKRPVLLDVEAALAIACGVCAALSHVHERGIVHRDVKPGNILLARSGAVKLIDFGIAQRPRTHSVSDGFGEGITASGRMAPEQLKDAFGTPAYMSPEQILGDFVDGRSDLFSLGVVLYEMLSGVRPFDRAGDGDVDGKDDGKRSAAQRIRRDAPKALRERRPDVPRAVERIVMRLLEKSPNDRYPNADALKERLEAALRAETREDPGAVMRRLLGASALPEEPSATGPKAAPATRPNAAPPERRSAALGLRPAFLGFGAVLLLFVAGVLAIELGSSAREARSAAGAAGRALELAPDRAGGLRVVATPWAYVKVDGQLVETTPFARAIPLSAGKHWVTLTHPDARSPIERSIEIVAGETQTLEVTLDLSAEDAGKDAR